MSIKTYILKTLLIASIYFCVSCKPTKKTESVLTEGVIEYNTTVIDSSNPLADFAPATSIVSFKENNLHAEMSVMGV